MRASSILWTCAIVTCLSCRPETTVRELVSSTPSTTAQAVLRVHQDGYDHIGDNRAADQYVAIDSLQLAADLDPKRQYIMCEGPVLENDVIGYRLYADSRHRFDVFGKSVSDLVLDTVGWHYHDIMPWGSDILKVGNSLGIGSPAIYYQDSIYSLSSNSYKTITAVQEGDEVGFRMILTDLHVGSDTFTIEHTWTIGTSKPHASNRLKVLNGKLPKGARFCTGIVRHEDEVHTATENGKQALYTFGKQSYHGHEMGMAIVTDTDVATNYYDDPLSHIWLFGTGLAEVSYDIAASWQLDSQGVKSIEQFESLVLQ